MRVYQTVWFQWMKLEKALPETNSVPSIVCSRFWCPNLWPLNLGPLLFTITTPKFVYMPAAKACKAYKFARPFHGPYRIMLNIYNNLGVLVQPVDRTQVEPIRIAYDWIRKCLEEIPAQFWPNCTKKRRINNQETDSGSSDSPFNSTPSASSINIRLCYAYTKTSVPYSLSVLIWAFISGCIQSLDWTSGLDWWTGLLDSSFFFF